MTSLIFEFQKSSVEELKKDEDSTIEDVDEDKIDEILRDAGKNLVVFFCVFHSVIYVAQTMAERSVRAVARPCPRWRRSTMTSRPPATSRFVYSSEHCQVVKTDDRGVARELGVTTFPSLVYFRRRNPITYDGDFKDSEVVLRWLRAHDEACYLALFFFQNLYSKYFAVDSRWPPGS